MFIARARTAACSQSQRFCGILTPAAAPALDILAVDPRSPSPCARRQHHIGTEQWYECSEPSDDPVITCFLAPEWMNLEAETWLCSDALKSEDKRWRSSYGEDSY